MATRLYVGNLPFSVADWELKKLFRQAGVVESAEVVTERDSGRSRGFGFVEMASDEEAGRAMGMFDGYVMEHGPLRVDVALPRSDGRLSSSSRLK